MAIWRVPINIVFPGAGSPGVNVWHIRTGGVLPADEVTQANALIGYIRTFYNNLVGNYPTGVTLSLGTVTEEATQREMACTMTAVSGVGTGSAPQLLAMVVTWKTTIAARRGRGRTFIGPLSTSSMQSDGTPVDSFRTTVGTGAAALIASSVAYGNGAIGVYGYQNAKLPGKANLRNPADPKVFRDVTGYATRDLFGSLRSRRD